MSTQPMLDEVRIEMGADVWGRALRVEERLVLLRRPEARSICARPEQRAEAMRRWRRQSLLTEGSLFEQRLLASGLDQTSFEQLIAADPELVATVSPTPGWIRTFANLVHSNGDRAGTEWLAAIESQKHTFTPILFPFCVDALRHLTRVIDQLKQADPGVPLDRELCRATLLDDLLAQLGPMVSRTMVLELHVSRLRGQLAGNLPAERFKSFVDEHAVPRRSVALWAEYPVLLREVLAHIELWRTATEEFLRRLSDDWLRIVRAGLVPAKAGDLQTIRRVGDRHRRGRSVLVLQFTDGAKLVYKPRSLAIDAHFHDLLDWLTAHGFPLSFRHVHLVHGAGYGWSEYVEAAECSDHEALERFFVRQGAYIALLYALEATDFHYENIIACDEHPMLVDLESLFHPPVPESLANGADAAAKKSDQQLRPAYRVAAAADLGRSDDRRHRLERDGRQ